LLACFNETTLKDHWPIILFWAILFRFVSYATFPIFEDDIYRYLWDGYTFFTTGNPYGIPPADYFLKDDLGTLHSAILDGVAYPDIPTIYGPVCELIFMVSYWIAPMEIWPIRTFVLLADAGLLLCLHRLAPARGIVLYAWCPLIVHSFAMNLHSDIFGVFFIALALVLYKKQNTASWIGGGLAVCLALAVASKLFALLVVPFLIRKNWRIWLAFSLCLVVIYLPFVLQGATEWEGLRAMNQHWLFNASVFTLLNSIVGFGTAKILTMTLFLAIYAYMIRNAFLFNTGVPRGDIIFGVFFLLSAVVNPWYWIWALLFAAIYPSLWAWFCSAALMLSYATGINLPGWGLDSYQQPDWIVILEYSSIALVLLTNLKSSRGFEFSRARIP
jgi:hypothetical protein